MRSRRWSAVGIVALAGMLLSGCGSPPDKEMQQAEGALAAARAAGAEQYAREDYTAAQEALKQAHDSVDDRDYRQALNHALDASERAQDAAKAAADHKAAARVDADRALQAASTVVDEARAKLKTVEGNRQTAKSAAVLRRAIADADASLQKARAAFNQGDYLEIPAMLKDVGPRLKASIGDASVPAAPAPPRRRR